jgi:prepilin-type N-terminal cleavage/methylation domain-containing protein
MISPGRRQCGYSLIELLQVLVIFSIVMAIVFGLFLQIKHTIERREALNTLQDQASAGLHQMEGTITKAAGWVAGDTAGIILKDREDRTRTIRWMEQDSQVTIDGARLFPAPLRVPRFSLHFMPRADSAVMIREEDMFLTLDSDRNGMLEGGELAGARMVEIRLTISLRQQRIELRSMVTLPKPIADTVAER